MEELFITLDDVPKEEKLSVVQQIMNKAIRMGYVNQFGHSAESLFDCLDSQSVIALYGNGYFCASDLFLYGRKREPLVSAYEFLKEDTKRRILWKDLGLTWIGFVEKHG